jgi:hypothetical protein
MKTPDLVFPWCRGGGIRTHGLFVPKEHRGIRLSS